MESKDLRQDVIKYIVRDVDVMKVFESTNYSDELKLFIFTTKGWDAIQLERLSMDFIKKYSNFLDKREILLWQNVGEDYLENSLLSDPFNVYKRQALTENFIEKHKNEAYWLALATNSKIDKYILLKYLFNIRDEDLSKYTSEQLKNIEEDLAPRRNYKKFGRD